jgi:hypothetical protein
MAGAEVSPDVCIATVRYKRPGLGAGVGVASNSVDCGRRGRTSSCGGRLSVLLVIGGRGWTRGCRQTWAAIALHARGARLRIRQSDGRKHADNNEHYF